MTLSATDKTRVLAASQEAVELRAGAVRRYMAGYRRWLGLNNRYWTDPIAAIKKDLATGGLNSKHAAEYVAASAPLHACDGWSYLGRALQAHAVGSPDVARHLAYYAELRAAMSLLATRGIGIFDHQHFAVDSSGSALPIAKGQGTHRATWLCLEEWAKTPDGSSVVGSVIRPEGATLRDWVRALPGYAAWAPVGERWLLTLGLDLKRMAEDRDARNQASYRPTALTGTRFLSASDAASFVSEFVSLLEPRSAGDFNQLDAHFLRISLETSFRASTNSTALQARRRFAKAVTTAAVTMMPDEAARGHIIRFVTRAVVPDDPVLIREARATNSPPDARHHLQVLCRAALLLRVATGSVGALLRAAGLTFSMAEPWWKPLGDVRGLWTQAPAPEDIVDLWLDVASGLEDLRDWTDLQVDPTYRSFLDDCARPLQRVTSLECLALLGIAS